MIQPLELNYFDVCCNIASNFQGEILQIQQFPIFDVLLEKCKDSDKFEAKLFMLELLRTRMKVRDAENFFKVFEKTINENDFYIFRSNINPIRCGLCLYKMIDDLEQ